MKERRKGVETNEPFPLVDAEPSSDELGSIIVTFDQKLADHG
jgi:hypothetical protein